VRRSTLEKRYKDIKEINQQMKEKLQNLKDKARAIYNKKKKEEENKKQQEIESKLDRPKIPILPFDMPTKSQKVLKKVLKSNLKSPMSARYHNPARSVIKIYPDYNPKSRNLPVKAWETARTMATTPFTSPPEEEFEGFKNIANRLKSHKKPKTAVFKTRKRVKS
jgi:sugar-specific transcriptional regulator TrmB